MEIIELRKKFLEYFEAAGYKIMPESSLVPENDPSVLFTTAGMQQFKDYYSQPEAAPAKKLVTVQPVIRTSDISEVGDDTHLTSFEMLGIFNFGQQDAQAMKRDAIEAMWGFINQELGVEKSRVYASVFVGDDATPEDTQSEQVWQTLTVPVKKFGREDNFWGPTGDAGPCGPNSEIFIDDVEVGNLVFNQYYQSGDKKLELLKNFGLDFGSGLERLAATLQGKTSVWEIEPFKTWVANTDPSKPKESRIIIDHLRAITFITSAGVLPANKGREYILRRLIRKAVFLANNLSVGFDWDGAVAHIATYYREQYPHILTPGEIIDVVMIEKDQFDKNINRATIYLNNWLEKNTNASQEEITKLAFYMYESFGFPKELVIEHLSELGHNIDAKYFDQLFNKHQEVSRAGLAGQFKGGLADHEEQTIKHHTAHHLLLAALQQVLGPSVVQKGSNVTQERLRIDFNFERKLTDEEIKEVETIVNQKIAEDLPVTVTEMSRDDALASGAQAEFGAKYGDTVSVYSIGDFSKELCGGPHVEKTGQLGRFEILKEEASSQGVRRIKARCS